MRVEQRGEGGERGEDGERVDEDLGVSLGVAGQDHSEANLPEFGQRLRQAVAKVLGELSDGQVDSSSLYFHLLDVLFVVNVCGILQRSRAE